MRLDCEPTVLEFLSHLAKCALTISRRRSHELSIQFSRSGGKDLASELLSTLNEVRLELVPQHADDRPYWEQLICKVDGNPQHFNEAPMALKELVEDFGKAWKKPLSEYEIVYSIENLR